jgi:hypothetical protein
VSKSNAAFVRGRRLRTAASFAITVAALLVAACADSQNSPVTPPTELVGFVRDQDTEEPIADAFVVARYLGTNRYGRSVCNRVEAAVSDANGSFSFPDDPKAGIIFLSAYKRGYKRGNPIRRARQEVKSGETYQWRVYRYRWNDTNSLAEIVERESPVYATHADALKASREQLDAYVRKSDAKGAARLDELSYSIVGASCDGPSTTAAGVVAYYEAIYAEQVDMGEPEETLNSTRNFIEMARRQITVPGATK